MRKPNFDELKKSSPFEVPSGYFEEFPSRMEQQINRQAHTEKRLWQWLAPYFAVTASFLMLFLAWNLLLPVVTEEKEPSAGAPQVEQNLQLHSYYNAIEEYTLVNFLADTNNFNKQPVTSSEREAIVSFLTETDVERMLLMEEITRTANK